VRRAEETTSQTEFPVIQTAGQRKRDSVYGSDNALLASTGEAVTFEMLVARCSHLPWVSNALGIAFRNPAYGDPVVNETFRTLRSRLYAFREQQPLKTILVGSAEPAEGKSFVAANLARALVRHAGRRALLLDVDLRNPGLYRQIGSPMSPGLSEYIQGRADELSIIHQTPLTNLFFVPPGEVVPNAAELLENGKLQLLVQGIAPLFDWIILDSPPVIPVLDASMMAEWCDGVILVVRSGKTGRDCAQKACEEFKDRNLLGVVLNRVPRRSIHGSYYYGYSAPPSKRSHIRQS
jgi:capsular exopolysaccharide synthesis family protein